MTRHEITRQRLKITPHFNHRAPINSVALLYGVKYFDHSQIKSFVIQKVLKFFSLLPLLLMIRDKGIF